MSESLPPLVGPVVPAAPAIQPPWDLDVIACLRPGTVPGGDVRTFGVRWGSRPDLGFPPSGYILVRREGWQEEIREDLGVRFLPDTTDWASFADDAEDRRPASGIYFPSITEEELGYLLPLVRLADPRTPEAELDGLAAEAAAYFGDSHATDAGLAWKHWGYGPVPPLDDLLAGADTGPDLVAYYRNACTEFLLVLAMRFEFAVLFGLGTDDATTVPVVGYEVTAEWPQGRGTAGTGRSMSPTPCAPPSPAWLRAERTPGSVPHPAFAAWPGWTPPAELMPADPAGVPLPAETLVPRAPAAFTALEWAAPPAEDRLLPRGAVLYRVERYAYGAATAGQTTAPPLPVGAVFAPLVDGDHALRPETPPHYLDFPGMPWPPLEGHYAYQVSGVDLLGAVSTPPTRTAVRHHDTIAPPAPGARVLGERILSPDPATGTVTASIAIDWDATHDFAGPDAAELRVAAAWTPLVPLRVAVLSVVDVDLLHADVTVDTLAAAADALTGAVLSMPGMEFRIVTNEAGAGAVIRVWKNQGRLPAAGESGLIHAAGTSTSLTRVAKLARTPAVAATGLAASLGPQRLRLQLITTAPLPPEGPVRAYLHLLRATFAAELTAAGRLLIDVPAAGSAEEAAWARWTALPDPETALIGSPVLVYPPHELEVAASLPIGFESGVLRLVVTASDGVAYVDSPVLPVADPSLAPARGNESAGTELVFSVRSLAQPARPAVAAWVPGVRTWASSAAVFAESAEYTVTWSDAPDAARYEVWRALEGALSGVTPGSGDEEVRAAAAAQPQAFELRSDQVFAARYTDALPGRAPTRAVWQVRAVTAAGVRGEPSEVIGPVHVPDVRRPPAPSLLRAVAADPAVADRAISVEWTQPGPGDDLRWEVWAWAVDDAAAAPAPVGTVPRGTPADADGVVRFLHPSLVPGRRYAYQVTAVREALDPADASATLRRDVRGLASAVRVAAAISAAALAAPSGLAAAFDETTGEVTLSWTNQDAYQALQLSRTAPGRYVPVPAATLAGTDQGWSEAPGASGTWTYEVRALGVSRAAAAVRVQVVVP